MTGHTDAADADGATGTPPPAVSLSGVGKRYERGGEVVRALDDVSIDIPRGSYTAVMGPSGSGKSTLMNLVGCLDTPSAGTVLVDGEDVSALSDDGRARIRGQKVGFVFQTFNLMPRLTARENVALPLVFRGVDRADRLERADELLARVGLTDRTDHRPNELSGGQRQRVAIARALANDPAIVLADEPTGNLDAETGRAILGEFERLHEAGTTVLLVSHERHVAEHAERIVQLRDGEIEGIEEIEERRRAAVADAPDGPGGSPTGTGAPDGSDSPTGADGDR
ncbi:ABC transporter ATP-binding protein [Natronoarchaeum mannanilyticum]|uniref:ABC transporter ATP-binding protein n=1 Tax=Natronoarchaeum mannanilyticum TaxID=926360 RepID=UPI00361F6028